MLFSPFFLFIALLTISVLKDRFCVLLFCFMLKQPPPCTFPLPPPLEKKKKKNFPRIQVFQIHAIVLYFMYTG